MQLYSKISAQSCPEWVHIPSVGAQESEGVQLPEESTSGSLNLAEGYGGVPVYRSGYPFVMKAVADYTMVGYDQAGPPPNF